MRHLRESCVLGSIRAWGLPKRHAPPPEPEDAQKVVVMESSDDEERVIVVPRFASLRRKRKPRSPPVGDAADQRLCPLCHDPIKPGDEVWSLCHHHPMHVRCETFEYTDRQPDNRHRYVRNDCPYHCPVDEELFPPPVLNHEAEAEADAEDGSEDASSVSARDDDSTYSGSAVSSLATVRSRRRRRSVRAAPARQRRRVEAAADVEPDHDSCLDVLFEKGSAWVERFKDGRVCGGGVAMLEGLRGRGVARAVACPRMNLLTSASCDAVVAAPSDGFFHDYLQRCLSAAMPFALLVPVHYLVDDEFSAAAATHAFSYVPVGGSLRSMWLLYDGVDGGEVGVRGLYA